MARHIHIHLSPTLDADWEESKHPRAPDGKFGKGKGKGKETPKPASSLSPTARPATGVGDMRHNYHQTSLGAALRIVQDGEIKPLNSVNAEAAREIYGDTDGAHFVYLGLNRQAALNNGVGEGVIFHVAGGQLWQRSYVDKEMEGGIAMVKGPIPLSSVSHIEFTSKELADSPLGKQIMSTYMRKMRS